MDGGADGSIKDMFDRVRNGGIWGSCLFCVCTHTSWTPGLHHWVSLQGVTGGIRILRRNC